jgi:hypothetical protein
MRLGAAAAKGGDGRGSSSSSSGGSRSSSSTSGSDEESSSSDDDGDSSSSSSHQESSSSSEKGTTASSTPESDPAAWPEHVQRAAMSAGLTQWAQLLEAGQTLGDALRSRALIAVEGEGSCKSIFVHAGETRVRYL